MQSPFFQPRSLTQEGHLASLHLSRDQSLPVILSTAALKAEDEGYAEGVVTNTKYGSFPHSTLINIPWGSQVRASKVDTGSRGRQKSSKKRKAGAISTDIPISSGSSPAPREAVTASSGFIHVLPPTPETWTMSLPHRTQVVYTPDYSYILHRIRARPGSTIIEAGSGSGSFTHAAARAVYNGLASNSTPSTNSATASPSGITSGGKVYTFEFHAERHQKVMAEMEMHGLEPIVTATHRDVYKDGFLLSSKSDPIITITPAANAIFLDLPAPWEALPHLTRNNPSALDPRRPAHICTFSPCIEQAQKTISRLRRNGWVEIEMVEMQHRRLDVRREFVGLQYEGMRSVNAVPADVDEAVTKLREDEEKAREAHASNSTSKTDPTEKPKPNDSMQNYVQKQQDASKVLINQGRLIHRSEPDLKTHTSYLVFAILPQDWSDSDESQALEGLNESIRLAPKGPKSHRQIKKEAKLKRKTKEQTRAAHGGDNRHHSPNNSEN